MVWQWAWTLMPPLRLMASMRMASWQVCLALQLLMHALKALPCLPILIAGMKDDFH